MLLVGKQNQVSGNLNFQEKKILLFNEANRKWVQVESLDTMQLERIERKQYNTKANKNHLNS